MDSEIKNHGFGGRRHFGFSLVEVVTALMILAFMSSSVWVVINRCMSSAADTTLRMQAFEIARDNMESLLSGETAGVTVEYGVSERYPEVLWKTSIDTAQGPAGGKMWLEAVCESIYVDMAGNVQTVELTHWLTDLTKEQAARVEEEKERLEEEQEEEEEDEEGDDDCVPPGPGYPSYWCDMTPEEQRIWEEENRDECVPPTPRHPANWCDMTPREQRRWERRNPEPEIDPDCVHPGPGYPDDWCEMSREEKLRWFLRSI